MKKYFFTCFFILQINGQAQIQNDSIIKTLKKVANLIISQTKLGFLGTYNSQYYSSYKSINPDTTTVQFASSYGNWHYSNGVLNQAMLNLGCFVNDTNYIRYAINHIKFGLIIINSSSNILSTINHIVDTHSVNYL